VVFSSVSFVFLFLPLVVLCHFVLHPVLRNAVLLSASVMFYLVGEPSQFSVLGVSLAINYIGGLVIGTLSAERRWPALFVLVAANLLILFVFKYAGFVAGSVDAAAGTSLSHLYGLGQLALPLGISFFTFHGISYIVDVYRGTAPPQKDIFKFGIYFVFFPQLIAGPIIRYHDVADQLADRNPTWNDVYEGFQRFAIGLAKKVLLANPMGSIADAMFAIPNSEIDFFSAWLGTVSYMLQIYFDFSGYSDMAIGLARMFGVRFPENFNFPYISQSITEFWRRWHISLSSWFRDYLYVPLGGNRRGIGRTYLNLITVFVLCGLWHGASWNFLLWGVYYGVFLVIERMFAATAPRTPRFIRHFYALFVVAIGWVLFRAHDLPQAWSFLSAMFWPAWREGTTWALYTLEPGLLIVMAIAILASTPALQWAANQLEVLQPLPRRARDLVASALTFCVFLVSASFVVSSTYNPFIYFRF